MSISIDEKSFGTLTKVWITCILVLLGIYFVFIKDNSNVVANSNVKNEITCIGEFNNDDNTYDDYLHYLQDGKDMISCLVNVYGKSFKIPYGRLVKYDTLGNETISEYFLKELGPLEENEFFDKLDSQINAQYMSMDLAYKYGFYGVQGCDLNDGTGLCQAFFAGQRGIGKYKYDTFNVEFQGGGTSIQCDLNRQVRNYKGEDKLELLKDGVKNCKVIYTENGAEYIVGEEFKTKSEKENTLTYITEKINTEIAYINKKSDLKTMEGKVTKIIVNDNENYLDFNNTVNEIKEGEMGKQYVLEVKIPSNYGFGEYTTFNINGQYGTIKKGDNVEVNYINDTRWKVISINVLN